ncbi:MAG TPA: asparagine synthetase B, partial [Verrucomicrobiae bacterium]|nr:asparagine synthetase B [Verrucomicrobiae bacterium]
MCGVCGFAYRDASRPVDVSRLVQMRDVMTYRGPDDAGLYHGEGAALGSRRLAILDLSERGRMPMATRDGRYHIAYNGEVYNYRELRAELQAKG